VSVPTNLRAQELFTRTLSRSLDRWRLVLALVSMPEAGFPAARTTVFNNARQLLDTLIHRAGQRAQFPPEKVDEISRVVAEQSVEDAKTSIDAACLVFSHSVLDSAALDYCRTTALACPSDWEPDLEEKRVRLGFMRGRSYEEALLEILEKHFEQLEKESLLKKTDVLFARCRPPEGWSRIPGYEFDRARLSELDRLRHDIIHGDALGKPIPKGSEVVDFLMKTNWHLMSIVGYRYQLAVDPQFLGNYKPISNVFL